MLFPLFGVIMALSAAPLSHAADTAKFAVSLATPTVLHTPVVGVGDVLMADSIVVRKGKHTLTLFMAGMPVRTYKIALGSQPTGDKVRVGDGRTPEGLFRIDFKNAQSKYHMALHI